MAKNQNENDEIYTFTLNDVEYECKFNLKRIELIENTTNLPTLAMINNTNGLLSISSLKTYMGYTLKRVGEDNFIPFRMAQEIAEDAINTCGYVEIDNIVMNSLLRDCPFFFPENL